MRRVLSIALVLASSAAYGQQQPPDPAFLQQAIQALQAQRNHALDEAAIAEAQLAKAQQQVNELQKQSTDLKAKCGDACKEKDEK